MKIKKLVLAMSISVPLKSVYPVRNYDLTRLHQSPNYIRSFQPKKWWIGVDLGQNNVDQTVIHRHSPKSYLRMLYEVRRRKKGLMVDECSSFGDAELNSFYSLCTRRKTQQPWRTVIWMD